MAMYLHVKGKRRRAICRECRRLHGAKDCLRRRNRDRQRYDEIRRAMAIFRAQRVS